MEADGVDAEIIYGVLGTASRLNDTEASNEVLHIYNDWMWGSDYPHTDGIWPESSKYIERQFVGLSREVVHKSTCKNGGKFYGSIN